MNKKIRSGRRPKFMEESKPVTITLPQRILQKLEAIDLDRAKAVVKCVDNHLYGAWSDTKRVEIVRISKDTGLIVVGHSKILKKITWLNLIEIAPRRFLLAVPTGTTIETLEIAIMDLIENIPKDETSEYSLLTDLREKISKHRRREGVSKGEILYIHMDSDGKG
jgi:hypothetical protein